jgi:hypothetical protein
MISPTRPDVPNVGDFAVECRRTPPTRIERGVRRCPRVGPFGDVVFVDG